MKRIKSTSMVCLTALFAFACSDKAENNPEASQSATVSEEQVSTLMYFEGVNEEGEAIEGTGIFKEYKGSIAKDATQSEMLEIFASQATPIDTLGEDPKVSDDLSTESSTESFYCSKKPRRTCKWCYRFKNPFKFFKRRSCSNCNNRANYYSQSYSEHSSYSYSFASNGYNQYEAYGHNAHGHSGYSNSYIGNYSPNMFGGNYINVVPAWGNSQTACGGVNTAGCGRGYGHMTVFEGAPLTPYQVGY